VVNHEMGHHLGLLHPKSDQKCGKDSIASVMAQMSRGQQAIAPCLYENHLPIAIDGEALQRL
jgi:predicted Zn-dependent protease